MLGHFKSFRQSLAVYIDDMQMNPRSHRHGQGYLDLNGLIPEVIERLCHYAGFAKWSAPLGGAELALTAHAYRATWRPTEQIPERIISSPVCTDMFCAPDPTAQGETTRIIAPRRAGG